MIVRTVEEKDLFEIVNVHRACFPNSFSTCIGKKLLKDYYFCCHNFNPKLFLVACKEQQIVGFIVGCFDGGKEINNAFKKRNKVRLALMLFWKLLILDMRAWKKVFHKKGKLTYRNPKYNGMDKSKAGSLLCICVLNEFRGNNVAQDLEKSFVDELIVENKEYCFLAVENTNERAIRFYEKQGYEKKNVIGSSSIYVKKI